MTKKRLGILILIVVLVIIGMYFWWLRPLDLRSLLSGKLTGGDNRWSNRKSDEDKAEGPFSRPLEVYLN